MASKTETIDSRILRLIGLEDVFDLDYGTYASLLKEALVKYGVVGKDKIPTEEIELLREEYKRVRKEEGRFKVKPQAKKTKISADSLRPIPKLMGTADKIDPNKLLPPSQEENTKEPEQDSIIKILTDISESVKSILKSLKASNNISKNLANDERKRRETKKRSGAESKLEKKRFEGLKKIGGKLIQPIKGPLDALFNFLKNVILGRVVIGIIDWLGDPENQKKLESLGRFFMDWWPTIVTAVLLFGTGLGGLLKTIVGITFKFIPKLLGLLPGLLRFLKSPMGRIAGLAVGALGVAGIMGDGGKDDVDLTKQDPAPAQTTPAPQQTPEPMREGGMVPGKGPNKDTVPAMLAPGEFVMSRGAVQKYGADTMASMNAAAGGTNRPDVRGGITYAASGGMIGDHGREEASPKLTSEMAKRDRASGGDLNPDDTAESRLGDLMKSTDPKKIAAYDAKHGQGAYQVKLKEKLGKIYSTSSPSGTVAPKSMPKPTGKVVGRENLPPATRALLEKMDAQRAGGTQPAAMQYTKDGKKISAKQFNRVQGMMGAAKEGGAKGVLNHMMSGVKSMFGGMFDKAQGAVNDPKSFVESMGGTVIDSNSQEQNMKRVMALPPEMRKAVLADMKRSGSEVKESSGINLPGATADRQLVKVQPGESILPVDTVAKLGGPEAVDRLIAQTDSNSTPAKLGMRSKKMLQVSPPAPMQPQINLIPTQTSSGKGYGNSSGSALPNFDAGTGDPNKAKLLGVVR